MRVVVAVSASDSGSLAAVSRWTHDARLLTAAPDVRVRDGEVAVEFQQEPLDADLDLPRRELVRRSWWATDYRLPFVRCRLTVAAARGVAVSDPDLSDGDLLLGMTWDAREHRVEIHTTSGPIAIDTAALDVRLEISDEIVSMRRRRVGRVLRFAATSGPFWPCGTSVWEVADAVSIPSPEDRDALARAWTSLNERGFPGSGEQLEHDLADELSGEMAYEDSTIAGAVSSLLGHAATSRRYLEPNNEVYNRLLTAARERRDEHPDLERVLAYAEALELVRHLALRLAR